MSASVVMGDRGRIVLPAPIRKELGLNPGARLAISIEADGSLRMETFANIAHRTRGILADLAPPDVSMVDELIAERRAEAAREDAEERAYAERLEDTKN